MELFTEKSRKKDQRSVFGAPSTGVPVSAVEDRVVRQECARFSKRTHAHTAFGADRG